MPTEIIWRTALGELCGVTIHAPDADYPHVRLVIGSGFTLRLPRIEAGLLATALRDAAEAGIPASAPERRVIPIHPAPIPALYREPEQEQTP